MSCGLCVCVRFCSLSLPPSMSGSGVVYLLFSHFMRLRRRMVRVYDDTKTARAAAARAAESKGKVYTVRPVGGPINAWGDEGGVGTGQEGAKEGEGKAMPDCHAVEPSANNVSSL